MASRRRLAVVAALGALAVLGACSEATAPLIDWDEWPHGRVVLPQGVMLSAEVIRPAETPNSMFVEWTATNSGTSAATMTYNDCALGIRVYADPAADPVYHNIRPPDTACLTVTRQLVLGAGMSAVVPMPAREIDLTALRSSIGPGTYTVVGTYRTVIDGPVIEVPAGQLQL